MKVGLFFGSFNPVHNGHLMLANVILEYSGIQELWFVVSPQNPLKEKKSLLADHHRLELVHLALQDHPKMRVSDVEFKMDKPSYTVKTLAYLSEKYPKYEFSLIIGSDNLESFTKWKNYESILKNYRILVYPRPGHDGGALKEHTAVQWVNNVPLLEVSSTFIREAIKNKKDLSFFLPQKAWNYLKEMHFYE